MPGINSVYESLRPTLLGIAFGIMKHIEDAQEVVNDVFIKMMELNKIFASQRELEYYAIRVTKNACFNRLRVIKRRRQHAARWCLNNTQDTVDAIEAPVETYELIRNAVAQLDVQYKPVICMYYYEGKTCEEISGILNLSIDSVRYRIKAGRKLIKAAVI